MGNDSDDESTPEVPTEAFVLEVVRRSSVLDALQSSPASASELVDRVDVSRSTIHRATESLVELDLIAKSDGTFSLTSYGRIVAEQTTAFGDRMAATHLLKPFLTYADMPGFPVEHFLDAEVIEPKPRQPHYSVRRIMELIEGTDDLRVFSSVISPFYVEVAHREMMDGMNAEVIFDEETIDIVLREYREQTEEAIEAGRFDVFAYNDLPFELFLFDDCIGMAAHDDDGIARVLVVSSSSAAIEWAEELYEQYREKAQRLTGPV